MPLSPSPKHATLTPLPTRTIRITKRQCIFQIAWRLAFLILFLVGNVLTHKNLSGFLIHLMAPFLMMFQGVIEIGYLRRVLREGEFEIADDRPYLSPKRKAVEKLYCSMTVPCLLWIILFPAALSPFHFSFEIYMAIGAVNAIITMSILIAAYLRGLRKLNRAAVNSFIAESLANAEPSVAVSNALAEVPSGHWWTQSALREDTPQTQKIGR